MDYNRIADNVLRMLTKYGRPATLSQFSVGGSYDPSKGFAAPAGPVDSTRQVLAADQPGARIAKQFGQRADQATLVQRAEKWIYMDTKGPKPGLQDKVTFDGVTYAIDDVQELKPGPVALFYLIVLRT